MPYQETTNDQGEFLPLDVENFLTAKQHEPFRIAVQLVA